ncbi:MAG: hypothetical protein ABI579_02145, partial [Candidatus Sumerlaeota bacterium]
MERLQTTSTSVKRPWGGQLDAEPDLSLKPQRDGLAMLGALLKKWTELCLLATLVAVPLMYHFSLSDTALKTIRDWFY